MSINLDKFKICSCKQIDGFRPERPEYFSPGHNFWRNDRNDALGNGIKRQTVREGKLKKVENNLLDRIVPEKLIKTETQPFRPKQLSPIDERYCADDFNRSHSTPGDARGYYNLSLSGKRKIQLKQML